MKTNSNILKYNKPKKYRSILVPEYPKKICIGVQEHFCNLSCPKCMVHGNNRSPNFNIEDIVTDVMPMEKVIQILDEVKGFDLNIVPSFWVEPLVIKDFKRILRAAKERGIPTSINTNNLFIN